MSSAPDTIGRHRILDILGAGGFATVYLAEDPRLEALVAIKLLDGKWSADVDLRRRFIAEARVMRRLAAPGLVTVFDIDEHEGRPYFVMEHCDRGTLAGRLDEFGRPISVDEALGLADALASPTATIHRAEVVHRDLKPSNYLLRSSHRRAPDSGSQLLGPDEELLVADFGLAKAIQTDATRLSIAAGTPGYGAPEQFTGDPTVDTRADVYALSAIILSALSGIQPRLVLGGEGNAFPDDAWASAGPLATELARGLSIDRAERQLDVFEWHEALHASVSNADTSPIRPTPARTTKRGGPPDPLPVDGDGTDDESRLATRRARPWLRRATVAAVVAALSLLAVVGLLATGLASLPGPTIHGPADGTVGDEAVFAVDADEPYGWSIDGVELVRGRVVSFSPEEAGTLDIRASSGFRSSSVEFVANEPAGELRIVGPGHAPVGEATRFTVEGHAGLGITWLIDGDEQQGSTIDLTPVRPGTIELQATSVGGERVQRTVTATAAANE